MASLAAAALEHTLAAKKFRLDRTQPVEELLTVAVGELVVMRPLVAERLGSPLLDFADCTGKARHAAFNRIACVARCAVQCTAHHLAVGFGIPLEMEMACA